MLEADRPGPGGSCAAPGRSATSSGSSMHLEDALARGGRALRLADPHAERAQRHHEHREVEVERDEAAGRERAVRDHARADEQHGGLREQRHERDQRHVGRALAVRAQRLLEDALGAAVELRLLGRLLRERLDDVDADDVLLGDRRDVGELLLHVAQRRVRRRGCSGTRAATSSGVTASTISASRHSKKNRTTVTERTVSTFWKKKIRP